MTVFCLAVITSRQGSSQVLFIDLVYEDYFKYNKNSNAYLKLFFMSWFLQFQFMGSIIIVLFFNHS